MGADQAGLSPSQRIRLEQLAARLVLGEGFRPEDAVSAAAELVAEGIEVEGVVALAFLRLIRSASAATRWRPFSVRRWQMSASRHHLGRPRRGRWRGSMRSAMADGVIPSEEGARRL